MGSFNFSFRKIFTYIIHIQYVSNLNGFYVLFHIFYLSLGCVFVFRIVEGTSNLPICFCINNHYFRFLCIYFFFIVFLMLPPEFFWIYFCRVGNIILGNNLLLLWCVIKLHNVELYIPIFNPILVELSSL